MVIPLEYGKVFFTANNFVDFQVSLERFFSNVHYPSLMMSFSRVYIIHLKAPDENLYAVTAKSPETECVFLQLHPLKIDLKTKSDFNLNLKPKVEQGLNRLIARINEKLFSKTPNAAPRIGREKLQSFKYFSSLAPRLRSVLAEEDQQKGFKSSFYIENDPEDSAMWALFRRDEGEIARGCVIAYIPANQDWEVYSSFKNALAYKSLIREIRQFLQEYNEDKKAMQAETAFNIPKPPPKTSMSPEETAQTLMILRDVNNWTNDRADRKVKLFAETPKPKFRVLGNPDIIGFQLRTQGRFTLPSNPDRKQPDAIEKQYLPLSLQKFGSTT